MCSICSYGKLGSLCRAFCGLWHCSSSLEHSYATPPVRGWTEWGLLSSCFPFWPCRFLRLLELCLFQTCWFDLVMIWPAVRRLKGQVEVLMCFTEVLYIWRIKSSKRDVQHFLLIMASHNVTWCSCSKSLFPGSSSGCKCGASNLCCFQDDWAELCGVAERKWNEACWQVLKAGIITTRSADLSLPWWVMFRLIGWGRIVLSRFHARRQSTSICFTLPSNEEWLYINAGECEMTSPT